jgi:hypothetical protein
MATAQVVKQIEAPVDAVWKQIANFAGIRPGGPIESATYEGEGVGMIRTLGMGGGHVVERLEFHDEAARRFTYAIINDDCPLPFAGYAATVQLGDNGDGTTTVIWTGTFEAKGVPEADAVRTATGIYAGGIKATALALKA